MTSPKEDDLNLINIGVSSKLGEIKANILKTGNELEKELHSGVAGFVSDTLNEFESHVCRIAFIGQIKAGKSSLINALIQKPGFLPTDVNPSTAVVTKVFFGSQRQAGNTALFHFFTESEWEGLISGKSRDPKGSGLFSLPGTQKKLAELQRRAEERLGANFSKVLGKHHLFSSITPQLLGQYVSTGDYAQRLESTKLYSDVTKMAEIFLEGKPFTYPSVLIDTPGINDFFFIRDDITHSNLADADIYILVLTAQQPLSSGDLSLLRLLRGLQKDKIIAVVNRIDGLGDVLNQSGELEAFVRATLRRECPHATIPVILASAKWGNAALNGNAAKPDYLLTPDFRRYAAHRGFGEDLGKNGGEAGRAFNGNDSRMLLACSGIPKLVELMSQFIANAVTEEQLLPCASTLSAIAHNTAIASRFSLKALAPEKSSGPSLASPSEAIRRQAHTSLSGLEALIADVEQLLKSALLDCDRTVSGEVLTLERYIYHSIDAFAEAQAAAFIESRSTRGFLDAFSGEALRFRSDLADAFARYYTEISKIISDKQRETETSLRKMMKAMLPALDNVVQFGLTARKAKPPSIMSLGKATALETAEFWDLKAAEIAGPDSVRQDELKRAIATEFIVILRELVGLARSDLKLNSSNMIRRLRILAFSAVLPLIEQIEKLIEAYKKDTAGAGGQAELSFMSAFQNRLKENIARQEMLAAQLNDLKKQCFLLPLG